MSIKVGDTLPQVTFRIMSADGPLAKSTDDLFAGKKVVLFAVPGAFTPTCHKNHLPEYLTNIEAFKAKGVDRVAVTSTNDVFVMKAWNEASNSGDNIQFLSDGNADFAKAVGLTFDGSGFGMGIRSQRYAMLVENGEVKILNIEDTPAKADISGAKHMLEML
jgi:glutaredoxin/glutathione-dependent peroxiredoxin